MSKFDLEKILEQARKLQSNMNKTTESLENMRIEGQSGAGLVKAICNGRHDVISINIDPEALKEDKKILEELIAAAVNDAMRRIEKEAKAKIFDIAKGLNLDAINTNNKDEEEN